MKLLKIEYTSSQQTSRQVYDLAVINENLLFRCFFTAFKKRNELYKKTFLWQRKTQGKKGETCQVVMFIFWVQHWARYPLFQKRKYIFRSYSLFSFWDHFMIACCTELINVKWHSAYIQVSVNSQFKKVCKSIVSNFLF